MINIDFNTIQTGIKNKQFPLIGKGTSRKVYDLNNGYCVKVAIGEKGIGQNKSENEIYNNDTNDYNSMNIFAKIEDMSENGKYLIVEKCTKIKSIQAVKKLLDDTQGEEIEAVFNDLCNDLNCNYDLCPGDLKRVSSWGTNSQGHTVLIDYGCTNTIYNKFYSYSARQQLLANKNRYAYGY